MTIRPPLTDDDYAAVRRSVMTTIAAQESRRTWLVRGMQLGFAVLAIAVFTLWLTKMTDQRSIIPQVKHPQLAKTSSHPATQQPSHPFIQQPSQLASQQSATSVSLRPRDHAIHQTASRRHPRTPEPTPEPLRIQLATNDPDIRIIWITNSNESR